MAAPSFYGNEQMKKKGLGNLDSTQLLNPQLGQGETFRANARQEGFNTLKGAYSEANPADMEAAGGLRDYYKQATGQLGQLGNLRGTALDTQMQGGLRNLLQQYKNVNAGTGRIGSAQYGRGQGDITARIASEYAKGMSDLSGQQLQNAGQIGAGLGDIYRQDLAERSFQNQQAGGLADWLSQQSSGDLSRDQGLAEIAAQKRANDPWNQALNLGGSALGMYLGGLAGRK
jgi:hypothetical protein